VPLDYKRCGGQQKTGHKFMGRWERRRGVKGCEKDNA